MSPQGQERAELWQSCDRPQFGIHIVLGFSAWLCDIRSGLIPGLSTNHIRYEHGISCLAISARCKSVVSLLFGVLYLLLLHREVLSRSCRPKVFLPYNHKFTLNLPTSSCFIPHYMFFSSLAASFVPIPAVSPWLPLSLRQIDHYVMKCTTSEDQVPISWVILA